MMTGLINKVFGRFPEPINVTVGVKHNTDLFYTSNSIREAGCYIRHGLKAAGKFEDKQSSLYKAASRRIWSAVGKGNKPFPSLWIKLCFGGLLGFFFGPILTK